MTYQAVISSSATDWTGTWLVTDEQYNTISKHSSREAAEQEAERLNSKKEVKAMKRKFDFGCIDFEGRGKALNRVTVEMEYKEIRDKKRFSVCADVWNGRHSDIVAGGQCLDTIAPYIKNPLYSEILRLWELYHLNDMHPECEHQRALGWLDEAKKNVNIYHWYLNDEARKEKEAAKKRAFESLKNGETFTPTAQEVFYTNLETFCKTYTAEAPEHYDINKDYNTKKQKIDVRRLSHICATEHPEGILCKPCPVCGYKYGSSWLYVPIPAEDEAIILKLLKEGSL